MYAYLKINLKVKVSFLNPSYRFLKRPVCCHLLNTAVSRRQLYILKPLTWELIVKGKHLLKPHITEGLPRLHDGFVLDPHCHVNMSRSRSNPCQPGGGARGRTSSQAEQKTTALVIMSSAEPERQHAMLGLLPSRAGKCQSR